MSKKTPIYCPACGSREIVLLTEYHKSIICKIASFVSLAIIVFQAISALPSLLAGTLKEYEYTVLLIFGIAYVVLKILTYLIEAKTHIQGVCKECSHKWLLK